MIKLLVLYNKKWVLELRLDANMESLKVSEFIGKNYEGFLVI